jgi:hypothetical protein
MILLDTFGSQLRLEFAIDFFYWILIDFDLRLCER